MTEHWKIKILRNHLKTLKEEGSKGTVTRDEKRDVELRIYYYQLGVKFVSESPSSKHKNKELGVCGENDIWCDECNPNKEAKV